MVARESRELTRIDPFEELDLFRDPFGIARFLGRGCLQPPEKAARFVPVVDIAEDDDQYVITAEVPGARKDDVTVELQDNVLTILGEKLSGREAKKEHARYVERCYGSFSRAFTLPANAASDEVKASFADGVLTVIVPKAEEAKPKVITIQ